MESIESKTKQAMDIIKNEGKEKILPTDEYIRKMLKPARFLDESFEDYKTRRKNANEYVKRKHGFRLFWNSLRNGTYVKKEQKQ